MAGYTRNDTSNNIATGNVINAADLDGEFDALVAAFHASTGHTHDGTAANGAPITKIGPAQDLVISTGAITPKTDNTVDLGSSSFEFKDLYIDGTANIDALVADTADINAGTIDGVTLGTNSAVTEAQIDNININGNTISSTDTNGNISLVPNGTGDVILTADTIQVGDSNTDVTVTTNGTGDLIFNTNAGTNSGVIRIYDGANGNIALTPNGTGEVDISKVDIDSGAIDGTAIGANSASTGAFTTLSASSTVTLSGGTANGVLYLNGSKVATSGSALTFDGSTLTETNATSAANLVLNNTVSGKQTYINLNSGATVLNSVYRPATTNDFQFDANYGSIVWGIGSAGTATEQMRLTSTGLGIGTSSPGAKLNTSIAAGSASSTNIHYLLSETGTNSDTGMQIKATNSSNSWDAGAITFRREGAADSYSLQFATSSSGTNATQMTLNSSGNLGLGVTPSAGKVGTYTKNFEIGAVGNTIRGDGSSAIIVAANAYYDATDSRWEYAWTNLATNYTQLDGIHKWYIAPSGTAGNAISFTQAMTLDASGNLGVGQTSPTACVHVTKDGTGNYSQAYFTNANSTAAFAIGVGGSAVSASALQNNAYLYNVNNSAMVFGTNNTERARITSGGSLLIGSTSNNGKLYVEQSSEVNTAKFWDTNGTTTSDGVLAVLASRNTTNNTFYAISYYNSGVSAYKFRVADSGDVTNTNGTYGTISDAKMKTDIVDAGSQWADIKAIRFRKFKMKDDPSGLVQLGVVAQELEQTSPGLVDEHVDRDAEGNDLGTTTKSVKTSILLMKAAKALQEAMARIETLEAKVSALEGN